MNNDLFISKLLKGSYNEKIIWFVVEDVPNILNSSTERRITSCFQADIKGVSDSSNTLLLFKYSAPNYCGENDLWYNGEGIGLAMIKNEQYITWEYLTYSRTLVDLYDYVSSKYSGISDIYNML